MALIRMSGGFAPIPEGTYVFKIVEVEYKEQYGKLAITMQTAKGKKHIDDGMQYYYPNHDFWKILSQYHLNCVYGVDAHNPRDLLDLSLYDKAHDELKDLNLNFTDIII